MMNRATLMGNVGKDPEIRTTQSGTKVANFSLATSERWKDKQTGEQKEKTEWHRVTVWGDALIEQVVEKYIKKGSRLYIEGKIATREWQTEGGEKRYATEIVIQGLGGTIQLLDRKETGGQPPSHTAEPEGRYGASKAHQAPLNPPQHGNGTARNSALNDEIPFCPEVR